MREYYNSNPERREKKRARDREYAANNREKANERALTWYETNKQKVAIREAKRRYNFKSKAAMLLGSVCNRCGFKHLAALDFHHLDPTEKEFRVSDMISMSWEIVEKEILKCELLCKNCHAIEHCTWDEIFED